MNRHYQEGFTRVMINDLYDVEPQLQAFDEDLYIMWNPHNGQHLIMDGVTETAIMRIPQIGFPFLSSKVVSHIRSIKIEEQGQIIKQLEENERKREQESDKKADELALDFAKEMYKGDRKSVLIGAIS